MPKFTRKIEFNAYQFVPEEVTAEYGPGSIDTLIEEAFPNIPLNDAYITPQKVDMLGEVKLGYLTLSIYNFDRYGGDTSKETYRLFPGDWIYEFGGSDYEVVSDETFKAKGYELAE